MGQPLRVIVVGAGFGGLGAAIECAERGMHVTLVERYPDSNSYGDIIDFFANGGRIIARWGGGEVAEQLAAVTFNKVQDMELCKYDGKSLYRDPWYHRPKDTGLQFAGHRGAMHSVVAKFVEKMGVKLVFGKAVVDYRETPDRAGVVTSDGEEIWGDVVIAADGARSLAREKVLGLKDEKSSSGWAIYRAFFEVSDETRKDPLLKDFTDPARERIRIWISSATTMLGYAWNSGKNIAWVLMHKMRPVPLTLLLQDTEDIAESWSLPADKEDVSPLLVDHDAVCRALLNATPRDRLIDYKLVFRKPVDTWVSRGGRSILIGDACHCHLPSSAQGGSQALEDAVTVAVCLEKANGDVPLALRAAERIRFNRSNVIHASGASNRDEWHEIDWNALELDPKVLANRRFPWMLDFDAKATAEEHFDRIAQDIKSGKQGTLEELSLPSGQTDEIA
ncbi:hypothetical protein N0V84_012697 [Fusarium piperis]|uniref:FAD-binding domain-containing protein n=1 Tax=Fusarium piperis TaxID=1435070 RepID=A0A9W8W2I5_9HYPO|nr:hypothetical protein N0V84_012697 [Fusarium piperis]